nr:MAG TPA: hypothetical protein [Caudoviricetes sp.]
MFTVSFTDGGTSELLRSVTVKLTQMFHVKHSQKSEV